jgi:hypothetical protein
MIYDGAFFVMRPSMFGHAHIFFSFIMVCTHLKCYITSDVHLIMWKEMIERIKGSKKERCNILLHILPKVFLG